MTDMNEETSKFVRALIKHLNNGGTRDADWDADIDAEESTRKRKPVIYVDVWGQDEVETSFRLTVEQTVAGF